MTSSSSDGASKPVSLPQIQMLLGPFSVSSVQMWLRMQKQTYSASTREEMAKRVHDAIQKGNLTLQTVTDGIIGIEESRSKTVHLLRVKDQKQATGFDAREFQLAISALRRLLSCGEGGSMRRA